MAAAPAAARYSERTKDNDLTYHSFGIGFWRRWRLLRTLSLGSFRRALVSGLGTILLIILLLYMLGMFPLR